GTEPPAEGVKTKAEVLEEISRKVQAGMESRGEAQSEAPIPYRADTETPAGAQPQEEVSGPETSQEETRVKTAEKADIPEAPAAEPPAPPTVTPEVKTEEAPSEEVSVIEEDNAEAAREVKTEEGTEEPNAKESDEGKIKALNQKIMEQAGTDKLNKVAEETISGESETPQAQIPDEGKGAEPPSVKINAEDTKPANAGPVIENKEVAAMPPGEAAGDLKEEKAPADDVISWCRERCETPAELENCMKLRAVAKDKIDKLTNTFSGGTKEREVLDKCMSDWKEGSTYNYEMAISCTQFFCTQGHIEGCTNLGN
ncbi:MAG: hypothetical protein L0213_12075, partial [Candidatus Dadabacteria bacterium]|nr:hypothetical protein [Candidatus Dadabacteria bacterium]